MNQYNNNNTRKLGVNGNPSGENSRVDLGKRTRQSEKPSQYIKDISDVDDNYRQVILNSIESLEAALGFNEIRDEKGESLKTKSFKEFHINYVNSLKGLPAYKLNSMKKNTVNGIAKLTLISETLKYNQLVKFNIFDLVACKDLLIKMDKLRFRLPTPSGRTGVKSHRDQMLLDERFIAAVLEVSDNSTPNIENILAFRMCRLVCGFILVMDYASAGTLASILTEQAIVKQHLNRKGA